MADSSLPFKLQLVVSFYYFIEWSMILALRRVIPTAIVSAPYEEPSWDLSEAEAISN